MSAAAPVGGGRNCPSNSSQANQKCAAGAMPFLAAQFCGRGMAGGSHGCQKKFLWHSLRMKSFLVATVVLFFLLAPARAQQEADEKYIAIYGVVQQAENLADTGEPQQALASLTEAQAQLQQFQKIYPGWNPGIISYRLDDLAKKIAGHQGADCGGERARGGGARRCRVVRCGRREIVGAGRAACGRSCSRCSRKTRRCRPSSRRRFRPQPAAIDAGELAKAQEQIRSLMKENDLLKAGEAVASGKMAGWTRTAFPNCAGNWPTRSTNIPRSIRARKNLSRKMRRCSATSSRRAGRIPPRWTCCAVKTSGLKTQLAALQSAANDAAAAKELAAKLKDARTQIASLQTEVRVASLEKGALENKVMQLSAEVAELRAANFEGRIRDLTEQRDELAKQLAAAGKKTSAQGCGRATGRAEPARWRRCAPGWPWTRRSRCLTRRTSWRCSGRAAPQPNADPNRHSIHELPSGTRRTGGVGATAFFQPRI